MKIYRLDRRFVLQAIGINLLVAAVALSVVAAFSQVWLQVIAVVLAAVLLGRAVLLWLRPPVVAQTDQDVVVLGGPLTVRAVEISWADVSDVSVDKQQIFLDRGTSVLAFPLAFTGSRGPELLRDVYDRLNAAHGYRRFELD